jgi:hypothetical protein
MTGLTAKLRVISIPLTVKPHRALYSNGIVRHALIVLIAMHGEHDIALSLESTDPASFMILPDVIAPEPEVLLRRLNRSTRAAASRHFENGSNPDQKASHVTGDTSDLLNAQRERDLLLHRFFPRTPVGRPTLPLACSCPRKMQCRRPYWVRKVERLRPMYAFLGKNA